MKRSYLEKGFTQEKLKNWRKISNKITFVDNKENTVFEDHLLLEEPNIFFEKYKQRLRNKWNSYIIDNNSNEIDSVKKTINKSEIILVFCRLRLG